MLWLAALAAIFLASLGCGGPPQGGPEIAREWPAGWAQLVGRQIALEGTARDAKLGAILVADDPPGECVWIDDLESWPAAVAGRRVRVAGTVIARDDLPVFVPAAGEPQRSGIPVEDPALLERARRRHLLTGTRWTLLE